MLTCPSSLPRGRGKEGQRPYYMRMSAVGVVVGGEEDGFALGGDPRQEQDLKCLHLHPGTLLCLGLGGHRVWFCSCCCEKPKNPVAGERSPLVWIELSPQYLPQLFASYGNVGLRGGGSAICNPEDRVGDSQMGSSIWVDHTQRALATCRALCWTWVRDECSWRDSKWGPPSSQAQGSVEAGDKGTGEENRISAGYPLGRSQG